MGQTKYGPPVVMGSEDIVAPKAHGTCTQPVQHDLRFGCDAKTADRICCFNRHYAEHSGYAWGTSWPTEIPEEPINYYDSVSGKQLFRAPVGRSRADFLAESKKHGWPSFRDAEVYWDNVRALANGETPCGTQTACSEAPLGQSLPRRHRAGAVEASELTA